MKTSNSVPNVAVDPENHSFLLNYSSLTGVPIRRVVNEAINDFRTTVAPARLEFLTAKKRTA